MRTAMLIMEALLGIAIIISILLQPSKADALSGLIQGKGDTFFAKNKSRTKEAMLVRITTVSAILFALNTIAINIVK